MKIDMNEVFIAFAKHYPRKAKQRGNLAVNDGITDIHYPPNSQYWDFHNSHYGEYIAAGGSKLITFQRAQNDGIFIFDTYRNDSLNGTELIAIESTILNNGAGLYWRPPIPVIHRYINLDALPLSTETLIVEDEVSRCQKHFRQGFMWGNSADRTGIYTFGGDIGQRWYIVIQSLYGIRESWALDLGPEKGNYAPRYGFLAYRHDHLDTGQWSVELYNTIVDFPQLQHPCPNL